MRLKRTPKDPRLALAERRLRHIRRKLGRANLGVPWARLELEIGTPKGYWGFAEEITDEPPHRYRIVLHTDLFAQGHSVKDRRDLIDDTLAHELAHVLHYEACANGLAPFADHHDEAWGRYYAAIYRSVWE